MLEQPDWTATTHLLAITSDGVGFAYRSGADLSTFPPAFPASPGR